MRSRTAYLHSTEIDTTNNNRHHRQLGRETGGGIASSRTRALIAAGLLAVSAAAPAAIAAAPEPDSEHDGSAPAAQESSADPAISPTYDPGGNASALPDTAPAPQAHRPAAPADDDDGVPVDQPSSTDVDDPVVDSGDGAGAAYDRGATGQTSSAAPVTAGPGTSAPAQSASDPGAAPATAGDAPAAAAAPAPPLPAPHRGTGARRIPTARSQPPRPPRRAALPGTATRPATASLSTAISGPVAAPRRTATAPTAPRRAAGRRARPGDRIHIVLAGESLWAIATDLLGRDAAPAEVAREVERLWRLNRARIGTGNPDLLFTGTTLVLR